MLYPFKKSSNFQSAERVFLDLFTVPYVFLKGNLHATMETDAMADTVLPVRNRSRPASFKITLQNVSEGLLIKDLRGLRFLCAGDGCNLIPMGKMEKIRSSLDLFEELESISLIFPPDEFSFLCELLHHVGRNDLLGCLQRTVSMVKASISESGSRVNSYRFV